MHPLLLAHVSIALVLLVCVRHHLLVLAGLAAPSFGYAHKEFDLACARQRAFRALQFAFVWHCLLTGFVHLYHAEHLRLCARRDAALAQPVPYGCAGNWNWEALSYPERVHEALLANALERCARYEESITIDVYPNLLLVLVDTVVLAPLRAVDQVADAFGESVARFLRHFSWLFQLVLLAIAPACVLLLVWFWPALAHTFKSTLALPPPPPPPVPRIESTTVVELLE